MRVEGQSCFKPCLLSGSGHGNGRHGHDHGRSHGQVTVCNALQVDMLHKDAKCEKADEDYQLTLKVRFLHSNNTPGVKRIMSDSSRESFPNV